MLLDQQVAMETALAGPQKIRERTGSVAAADIAASARNALVEVFRQTPAVHRYPGSMAKVRETKKAMKAAAKAKKEGGRPRHQLRLVRSRRSGAVTAPRPEP